MVSARCLIRSAREGICIAPLTRSRMVLKEVHSQFPGRAEQCFHCVPGPGASQRARTVAYHSLPDSCPRVQFCRVVVQRDLGMIQHHRSEEHTSELQSLTNLVCRLLLE